MPTDRKRQSSRLNLEVGPKARARLEQISTDTEQGFSDLVRNALALYYLFWTELKAGNKLIIRGTDGEKEVLIPELGPLSDKN